MTNLNEPVMDDEMRVEVAWYVDILIDHAREREEVIP